MLEKLSGAVEFGGFLESFFCGESNEQGFPEKYRTFWLSPCGEVTIVSLAAVPNGEGSRPAVARQGL